MPEPGAEQQRSRSMSNERLRGALEKRGVGLLDCLLVPVRLILLRLLQPMIAVEDELFRSLESEVEDIGREQQRLAAMLPRSSAEELGPRLVELEERLHQLTLQS